MSRIRLNVIVNAPKEQVFNVLTDLKGLPELQPSITSLELTTSGPIRIGTAWNLTRKLLEKETTTSLYVSDMQAPERLVIEGEGSGITYKTCYELIDSEHGTIIDMDLEGKSETFVASLMDKMTCSTLRDCLEDDLLRIKQAAEGRLEATRA
jgi:carbon monoxide dehydrogenase subunit G